MCLMKQKGILCLVKSDHMCPAGDVAMVTNVHGLDLNLYVTVSATAKQSVQSVQSKPFWRFLWPAHELVGETNRKCALHTTSD